MFKHIKIQPEKAIKIFQTKNFYVIFVFVNISDDFDAKMS